MILNQYLNMSERILSLQKDIIKDTKIHQQTLPKHLVEIGPEFDLHLDFSRTCIDWNDPDYGEKLHFWSSHSLAVSGRGEISVDSQWIFCLKAYIEKKTRQENQRQEKLRQQKQIRKNRYLELQQHFKSC